MFEIKICKYCYLPIYQDTPIVDIVTLENEEKQYAHIICALAAELRDFNTPNQPKLSLKGGLDNIK